MQCQAFTLLSLTIGFKETPLHPIKKLFIDYIYVIRDTYSHATLKNYTLKIYGKSGGVNLQYRKKNTEKGKYLSQNDLPRILSFNNLEILSKHPREGLPDLSKTIETTRDQIA